MRIGLGRERTRPGPNLTPEVLLIMKSIKRYLADFSLLAALAVALALACGGPFAGTNSARAQQQQMPAQAQPQQQPDQGQTKPSTFTGTVLKNGHYYVLRDS